MRKYLNDSFYFCEEFNDDFLKGKGKYSKVRIPHTFKEIPFNYVDVKSYQMTAGYRTNIKYLNSYKDKRVFVVFESAAHKSEVYFNGELLKEHGCGYTSFKVELTDYLKEGNNLLVVKLDSHETLNIPPFGHSIDYLCYGGIYRDVYLDIVPNAFIEDAYVAPVKNDDGYYLDISLNVNGASEDVLDINVLDNGESIYSSTYELLDNYTIKMDNVTEWNLDNPKLYEVVLKLGKSEYRVNVGFRTIKFRADGFYLNGQRIKLRGLNRHQSYPYVGYAMPDSMQREDVRILKDELACNIVRTSHYPQAHSFFDECDKRGLLVFTEIPGWQHIGDKKWKEQAVINTRDMIIEYRNHPSIIMWGVRINESQDDDEFYTKTNEVAHSLDKYRQTGGVRYLRKSNLLEDVYTFNDFSFAGNFKQDGILDKKEVTPDMNKAYYISEYNGHMFPTKSIDDYPHRNLHALRHMQVLNDIYRKDGVAGGTGWCMFDYNTHANFGSGDTICYHGVMDFFRNPKMAAAVYASQGDDVPVLEVSSSMEIGEYPGGVNKDVKVFSNADSIKLYKNGKFVKQFHPGETYKYLPHPCFEIDDFIGNLIKEREDYPEEVCDEIKGCLLATLKYGVDHLPFKYKFKMFKLMVFNHITMDEARRLYDVYCSGWGNEAFKYRFDAIKNGEVVKSVTKGPSWDLHLEVKTSSEHLKEGKTYDVASIRIRVLNGNNELAPYANEVLYLTCSDNIEIIGPDVINTTGGMTGTYIKTKKKGEAYLAIDSSRLGSHIIKFTID